MADRPCLMTIHAHPDDEASKGSATVARYTDQGARAVLVCCTGGEEGEILNPAMDRPEIRADLVEVRRRELAAATRIIGYDATHLLGYRDSGMPDSEANARSDAFANADIDEAVGRLVRIIRAERPHVIVTYSDNQLGYLHPDHLRVYDVTAPAWEKAGDPKAYPEAGEPWTPSKLYFTTWSKTRVVATHQKFGELGLESPYDDDWFEREWDDHRITTRVEIGPWYGRRVDALRAHATQVDPASPFWFGLPDAVARGVYPFDDYILADSRVPTTTPEDDLFAGIGGLEPLAAVEAVLAR